MNTTKQDLAAELAELDKDHDRKRQELTNEYAVRAALPPYAAEYKTRVHFHSLYGMDCSVNIDHDFYSYSKEAKQPDLALVARLGADLPPLPLVMVRDSCLSFRSKEHVEGLPEESKARWESETDVCPFLVKISGFQQRTAEFSWLTRIAGMVAEVELKLPLPAKLGKLDIVMKDIKGGRVVERCNFSPSPDLDPIFHDEEPLGQLERPIRWGRGSNDTPNDFTLYWIPLRDDKQATIADLVAQLIK